MIGKPKEPRVMPALLRIINIVRENNNNDTRIVNHKKKNAKIIIIIIILMMDPNIISIH